MQEGQCCWLSANDTSVLSSGTKKGRAQCHFFPRDFRAGEQKGDIPQNHQVCNTAQEWMWAVLCKMLVPVQGQPNPLTLLSLTFAWRSFVMDEEELAGSALGLCSCVCVVTY